MMTSEEVRRSADASFFGTDAFVSIPVEDDGSKQAESFADQTMHGCFQFKGYNKFNGKKPGEEMKPVASHCTCLHKKHEASSSDSSRIEHHMSPIPEGFTRKQVYFLFSLSQLRSKFSGLYWLVTLTSPAVLSILKLCAPLIHMRDGTCCTWRTGFLPLELQIVSSVSSFMSK